MHAGPHRRRRLRPPRAPGGLGSGLGTSAREIGAALGVAVTGTVLAVHEADARAGSFADAMSPALRTVGALVLVATALVAVGYRAGAEPTR
ncbi:hypothetical protein O1L60_35970 [Streptomyces diastatochromogenes]|nr:hypothetical protein [Streptomyces diastatochromogenes]